MGAVQTGVNIQARVIRLWLTGGILISGETITWFLPYYDLNLVPYGHATKAAGSDQVFAKLWCRIWYQ